MCRLRNIALESVTEKCDGLTDGRTTDKVIPMCRYASQATHKGEYYHNKGDSSNIELSYMKKCVLCFAFNVKYQLKTDALVIRVLQCYLEFSISTYTCILEEVYFVFQPIGEYHYW